MMVPRILNKHGFTLLEMMIVILCLGVFASMSLPVLSEQEMIQRFLWPGGYLQMQARAMALAENQEYVDSSRKLPVIYFNEKGNVKRAQTVYPGGKKIIIELGGGRLVTP